MSWSALPDNHEVGRSEDNSSLGVYHAAIVGHFGVCCVSIRRSRSGIPRWGTLGRPSGRFMAIPPSCRVCECPDPFHRTLLQFALEVCGIVGTIRLFFRETTQQQCLQFWRYRFAAPDGRRLGGGIEVFEANLQDGLPAKDG